MKFIRSRRIQVAALVIILFGYGLTAHRRQTRSGHDFPLYREAAATLIEGESPYDVKAGLNGYVYLPFFALVISPLTLVPESVAIWIWYVLNLVFTVLAFLLTRSLIRSLLGGRFATSAVWISLVVHARFFLSNYDMGQVNILLLLLLLWGTDLALVKGRAGAAGWPLGVALVIKPHAAMVLAPFVLRGRWRTVLVAAVAVVLGTAIVPVLLVGPGTTKQWLAEWHAQVVVPSWEGKLQGSATYDQSPQSALRRLVVDAPAFDNVKVNWLSVSENTYRRLTRALQLVLGLGFLFVWLRHPKRCSDFFLVDVALAFISMLVLFGYNLRAHFVMLLFPGAVLVALWRQRPETFRHRRLTSVLLSVSAALIVFSAQGLVGRTVQQWLLAYSAVTVATLIELTLLIVVRLRWKSRPGPFTGSVPG